MENNKKTMKKEQKTIVLVFGVLLALAVIVGGLLWMKNAKPAWYDVNATEFTITTADELYDLAELSETYDFSGQTIKLGADIVVNEGDAKDWADKAPAKRWHPITGFAGTFDGQGHSISGLYGDGIVTSMGLFTDTKKSSVIRDFQLVNSYFINGNDKGTGSIVGFGGGTLESVYSDAIIEGSNKYFGGLVGKLTVKAENKITNCWFDGTISVNGTEAAYVGGIVGSIEVADAMNLIEHSLNTGDIVSDGEKVGGICGSVAKGGFLRLDDSMSSGQVTYAEDAASVGSVLGEVDDSSSAFIADTYTVKEIKKETIGETAGNLNGNVIAKKEELLTGFGGYQWTTLDFDNYWAVKLDETPVLMSFAKEVPSLAGIAKKIDMSWYDKNQKEFVITTAEQLYGFSFLSISETFNNQIVKLGADIVINEGDANEWKENPPIYDWSPIGWHGTNTGQHFTGTFDGQGYTISGIYVKGDENEQYLGLFGEVYRTGTVKNLKLTNSYFEGTRDIAYQGIVGSIAGRNIGTIDTVYSDAVVVNTAKFTGGLVGMITGDGENLITNSWYDGQLYGTTNSGGVVGGVYGNRKDITATVQHCLNTGTLIISDDSTQIGGLCGVVQQGATLNLLDSLNSGTIEANDTVKKIGSVMGAVAKDKGGISHGIANSAYGVEEFSTKTIGYFNGDWTGHSANVAIASIKGNGGYQWTTLDFANYWAIRTKDTPILASFADSRPSVKGLTKMVDISWYSDSKKEFTISTAAQLYGFAQLTKTLDFEGKTIKLGADITVNEGNAADWAKNPPAYEWTPMGYQASGVGTHFKGTFDGQGHTISGIYVKGNADEEYLGLFGEVYRGATVKNLKLTNSYIEGNRDSSKRGCVGSIAGRALDMTIDSVYSDAILANTAKMTGGLVGMITDDGNSKITNCWFAGELHSATNTGGILGSIYGNKKKMSVIVEHCLNTGTFYISDGATQIGGLVGVVQQKGVLKLTDSLNTGSITTSGKVSKIGNAIGAVAKDGGGISTATLSNVYGAKEFASKAVAYCNGEKSETEIIILKSEYLEGYDGYRYTQLDFENYWVTQSADATPVLAKFAGSDKLDMTGVAKANTSWYSESAKEFTINNASELYGFALLSKTNDFEGQTIKLGADIVINEGDATSVKNAWMPIGYQGTESHFKGTFDGQGHSISGIYVKGDSDEQYLGLFGEIYRGATVKNLTLTNGYIEGTRESGTRGCVGSLAGRALDATIDSVYSDLTLVNSANVTGGLVGMITDDGNSKITNCWYAGELYGSNNSGGIVGSIYGNKKEMTVTIENCLNTGNFHISENATQIGGLVGVVQQKGVLKLTDSLNAGTITTADNVSKIGNAIGAVAKDGGGISIAELDNVHGIKEFASKAVGYCNGEMTEANSILLNEKYLKGYDGYRYAQLDFDKYWVVQSADSTPVLSHFVGSEKLDTTGVVKADISWYSEDGKDFTIDTPEELYGFTLLSKTYDFEGQTIKVGKDIAINSGDADSFATNPPIKNEWMPIGYQSSKIGVHFKGTLDGQDNEISGIYLKGDESEEYLGLFGEIYRGAAVKKLTLTNSYIEGTRPNDSRGCVGSLAGRALDMTIDSVYSDVTLVNSANKSAGTGGLVGMITDDGDSKITNSWYAGTLYGMGNSGGIVGLVYGNDKEMTVTMENCLNTGTLNIGSENVDRTQNVGGLCGAVSTGGVLKITDSFNAGTYNKTGTVTRVGNAVGTIAEGSSVELSQVHGIKEFASKMASRIDGELSESKDVLLNTEYLVGYDGYRYSQLNFDKYWVVQSEETTPVLSYFAGNNALDTTGVIKADISWYSENGTKFNIDTPEELYGLTLLSKTYDFEGQTILLDKNIKINESYNYELVPPTKNEWMPIGYQDATTGVHFKGTLDGQKNTISGIYVKGDENDKYVGLFGEIYHGTVQSLWIMDSYMEGTVASGEDGYVGSLAGSAIGATIDSVYSNVTLRNGAKMTGGLVGIVTAENDGDNSKITNSWYAGDLYGNTNTGGIVGSIYGSAKDMTVTMAHCLNTGTFHISEGALQIGGLVGVVQQNGELLLSDSLNTGTIIAADGVSKIGNAIGAVAKDKGGVGTADLDDVYGAKEFAEVVIAYCNGTKDETHTAVYAYDSLIGYEGRRLLTLDFAKYWVTERETTVPVLAEFAGDERLDMSVVIEPDTNWYETNEDEKVYTIMTPAELYGLAELSRIHNFAGWTIKLGANIPLNGTKTADQMAEIPPANVWTPIGYYAEGTGPEFQGIFDGKGYTISGIYAVANTQCRLGLFGTVGKDGIVQNLIIEESYFKNTYSGNSDSYMGSVTGVLHGTLDTIKSTAKLYSNTQYNGGLVGAILGLETGGEYTITNCWFDGTITGSNQKNGGLVGAINGNDIADGITAYISHCLNSGDIHMIAKEQQQAGICGAVHKNASLVMTDSLNVGNLTWAEGVDAHSNVGTIIGVVPENNSATLTNVYGNANAENWNNKVTGNGASRVTGDEDVIRSMEQLNSEAAYLNTNLDFYHEDLNNDGYWILVDDATPILRSFQGEATPLDYTTIDGARTAWYNPADADTTEYIIYTKAELYGLAELAKTNNFAGKTIKLGRNITLNENVYEKVDSGNIEDLVAWTPIGKYADSQDSQYEFKGKFDGNNKTISGVYATTAEQEYRGLFGTVGAGGIVQNLTIAESYFQNTKGANSGAYVGSVTGVLHGVLDTVKSTARIETNSYYAGGLVGAIIGSTECIADDGVDDYKITNCWFAGMVTSSNQKAAGIIGGINGADFEGEIKANISHCLNSATIKITARTQQYGGLCGLVANNADLNIDDCLNTGVLELGEGLPVATNSGSVIGLITNASVVGTNVYGRVEENVWGKAVLVSTQSSNTASLTINGVNTKVKEKINEQAARTGEQLSDVEAYKNMNLDFCINEADTSGYWIVVEGSTPILRSFKGNVQAKDVTNLVDVSTNEPYVRTVWFNEGTTTHIIKTAADLRGLSELSATEDFVNQTITLGEDIVLNDVTGDEWYKVDGVNVWTPIGYYDMTEDAIARKEFKGTFNGAGHTIKGIYAVTEKNETKYLGLFGTVGAGGIVQNLIIEQSYFDNNSGLNDKAYTGSVAGVLHGKVDTVRSTAEIDSTSQYTGGIVGAMLGSDDCVAGDDIEDYTITNCWFDGEITSGNQKTAGIIGGINASAFGKAFEVIMSHCLNSGDIHMTASKEQIGGLCGVVANKDLILKMEDCLNVGKLTWASGVTEKTNIGSVIGLITNASATVTNVYGCIADANETIWYNQAIKVAKSTTKNPNSAELIINTVTVKGADTGVNATINTHAGKTMTQLTGVSAENNQGLNLSFHNGTDGFWYVNSGKPVLYSFRNYLWPIVAE